MRGLVYLCIFTALCVGSIVQWLKSRRAMRDVLAEDGDALRSRLVSRAGETLFQNIGVMVNELADAAKIAGRAGDIHHDSDERFSRLTYRQSLAAELRENLRGLDEGDRAELVRLDLRVENLRGLFDRAESEERPVLVHAHQGLSSVHARLGEPQHDATVGPYR